MVRSALLGLPLAVLVACGQPADAQSPLVEARAHIAAGDAVAAQASLRQAIEADPAQAEPYRLLGEVHGALGEYPEAVLNFTKALERQPDDTPILVLRATAYLDAGQPQHALVDLDHAINLDPTELAAYVLRGETHAALGQLEGAIVDADVVVGTADDPTLTIDALWLRGTSRLTLGDLDGGVADLTRLLALDPQDGEAYAARGRANAARGQFAEAEGDLHRALEVAPGNPVPLLDLARVLLTQDRLDEARQAIDQAAAQLPDQPGLRLISGEYAARAGDVTRARNELEAAIGMADRDSPIAQRARTVLDQLTGR